MKKKITNQKLDAWSTSYWDHINRNIGLITFREQERIRTVKIAILGVGGLDRPLIENLVLEGCQNLVICDRDAFDESNLNQSLLKNTSEHKEMF